MKFGFETEFNLFSWLVGFEVYSVKFMYYPTKHCITFNLLCLSVTFTLSRSNEKDEKRT